MVLGTYVELSKNPYLAKLGVDMVWLNPFYPSPQRDNGYDISGLYGSWSSFGDMADFEEMVRVGQEQDWLYAGHGTQSLFDRAWMVSESPSWWQVLSRLFFIQDQPTDWQSKFGGSAWGPLGIQGNTTFTSLMRPRLILTGAIPMSVRSFSRLLILAR